MARKPTATDMFGTPSDVRNLISNVPTRAVDNKRVAAEAGLEGSQPLVDGMIDQSFRHRGERSVEGEAADLMYAREARERNNISKIMENLTELLNDGDVNPFTGQQAGITRSQLQKGKFDPNAINEPAMMSEDEDDDFIRPIKKAPAGNWSVVDSMAKSKASGMDIPIWKVQDDSRGVEVPHMFRIQEAAEMACHYLNQGQKENAKKMVEMDKRRFDLAKKAKVLKESNRTPEYRKVMAEIAQINTKLGI